MTPTRTAVMGPGLGRMPWRTYIIMQPVDLTLRDLGQHDNDHAKPCPARVICAGFVARELSAMFDACSGASHAAGNHAVGGVGDAFRGGFEAASSGPDRRWRRSVSIGAVVSAGRRLGLRSGLADRSRRPGRPSANLCTISIRLCGVVRALSWLSIRGSVLVGLGLATTGNQLSPGGTTPMATTAR